jgi:hypothetical protein
MKWTLVRQLWVIATLVVIICAALEPFVIGVNGDPPAIVKVVFAIINATVFGVAILILERLVIYLFRIFHRKSS